MQNIIDQILILLKESLSNDIRTFYQGNPLNLASSMIPVIYVEANGTDTEVGATGMDSVVHTITIGLIYDKRGEMGKPMNENVANRTMIEIMEGRNESNNQYSETSITGILRKYFTLNQSVNNQLLSLKYGMVNKNDVVYDEARITFSVSELIQVPSRV